MSGGEGVSQKGTKGDRGRGGGPRKRDVLLTNTDGNQQETKVLDIIPVFNKNDHWKSPLKKNF